MAHACLEGNPTEKKVLRRDLIDFDVYFTPTFWNNWSSNHTQGELKDRCVFSALGPLQKIIETYFHVKLKSKTFCFFHRFWLRQELKESQYVFVRPFIRWVQTCLEQSIFIFLGQSSNRALREHSESNQGAIRALREQSGSNQSTKRALRELSGSKGLKWQKRGFTGQNQKRWRKMCLIFNF